MLRRLRAVLGNALTWAVSWASWGFLTTLYISLFARRIPLPLWEGFPYLVVRWQAAFVVAAHSAVYGFIAGTAFSAVLSVIYRRHILSDLRAARLGVWGTLAGLTFPAILTGAGVALLPYSLSLSLIGTNLLFYGVPSAVTAVGTIKVAQRAIVGPNDILASLPDEGTSSA